MSSTGVSFDDFDDSGQTARPKIAFWETNFEDADDKDLLSWLSGELTFLKDANRDRYLRAQRNLALFKGIQYQTQESRSDIRDRTDDRSRLFRKIVANHLFDLTENRVSSLIKFKPAVAILPTNDEHSDKIAAKLTKMLLDHIWYNQRFEGEKTRWVAKWGSITGEAYLWIKWNPNIGDVHPSVEQAKKDAKSKGQPKVALVGEDGNPLKDSKGNTRFMESDIRVGDVDYEIVNLFEVLLDKRDSLDKSQFYFRRHTMPVAEARARWPNKAREIKADEESQFWDFEKMQMEPAKDSAVVWEFGHKKSPMLPGGRQIFFTNDVILTTTKSPYSHGDFPFERFTDIDLPGELHAASFFDIVKGLTGSYNNLTNMILRNQIMCAHPKWMVPMGAVKLDSLGNDITIVQYKGPVAPTLAQANPTGAETFKFRQELKEEFQQISGVFGVSRGDPPPGIKAAVALQFLAEQESERRNEIILKWNEFIRRVAIKTISVAGDYYASGDKRMLRIVGKNNEWMTQQFDVANLHKSFDIRIQNSSALPQSKAARLQTLLDLRHEFPDEIDAKMVLDMIDLAQSDKFLDITTVSIRAAEAENEAMAEGRDMNEPKPYEDLIEHWKVHVRYVQGFNYKNQSPPEIQEAFEVHIRTTEKLMFEKAAKNILFQKRMAELDLYPVFFTLPPIIPLQTQGLPPGDQGFLGAPGGITEVERQQQSNNPDQGLPVNQRGASRENQSPQVPPTAV